MNPRSHNFDGTNPIHTRPSSNLTVLLIEHQMRVVMGICEKITVMDFGEVIARGTAKEVSKQ